MYSISLLIMSNFRKALTTVELVEIRLSSDSADMRAVLWEIKRLRAIVSRADKLERSLGPRVGAPGLLRATLREKLDG
ncbi:hypothetical protein [Janthinobacterium psychrotolerans]|uniref:Uncharacterized protein n=1 Tax=Janthinobacterium psychrotolerans TaxID=1747903 RepID=A0A1A7C1I0_9BURK|nr:hypothetical protein [Janthinobacterium psychrotolerans]OBV39786.1 hypothetical protein ASR47_10128 [Janthinobacterium psychrotolerans]